MLGEYIRTVGMAFLYLLAMFGWGSLLLTIFPASRRSVIEDLATRIIAGSGVLYALFIGLSVGGLLHPAGVGLIVGGGVLCSIFFLRSILERSNESEIWDRTDRALLISVAALAGLQIILGLTPLVFYDLQIYHLLGPAQFLKAGSLVHIPWNVQANSPMAFQLVAGMSLAFDPSGQLAKFLLTLFGCLLPLGAFELVRPAGRRAALLAALFVLCFPEFWVMQTLGIVDLPIAGLIVFATLWVRRMVVSREWRFAILAGIAFGIALASRYQAVIITAWILLVSLASSAPGGSRRAADRHVLVQIVVLCIIVLAFVSPWMIRNYVHMGNPVYPLLQGVWPSAEWSDYQAAQLNAESLGPRLQSLPVVQQLFAPVMTLLVFPSNGLFGMALLFGGLMALAVGKVDVRLTALLGLGGLFIWGIIRPTAGVPLLRYNSVSLAMLLAVSGAVLAHEAFGAKAGSYIAAVLAGGSFLVAVFHVQNIFPAAQALTNATTRQVLRQASVPSWAALQYINQHLDRDRDKVLLIGETRGFWLGVPYVAPSSFNGPQLDAIFAADPSPDHWKDSLARLGITHLLISNPELKRLHEGYGYLQLSSTQMDTFNAWVQNLPQLFEDGRGTVVLALEKPFDEHVRSN